MGGEAELGCRDLANKDPLLGGGASGCQINFGGFPVITIGTFFG
jgi:hypothetical protein